MNRLNLTEVSFRDVTLLLHQQLPLKKLFQNTAIHRHFNEIKQ